MCDFTYFAELDVTKCEALGTDCAATMAGCSNGVPTRLNTITPSAIGMHCEAHGLKLTSHKLKMVFCE